jgi:predicted transcriptional regulator
MAGTTSVQITREASDILAEASKRSKLSKSYLAEIAIKYFFDEELNPGLEEAFRGLSSGRKQAEQEFMQSILRTRTEQEQSS